MSDDEEGSVAASASGADGEKPTKGRRQERSLGVLTTRFVKMLQEADGGIVDLKVAAAQVGVARGPNLQTHTRNDRP